MARRSALGGLRRSLYKAQRGIGDFQAAQRSPVAYGKRRVRRSATRGTIGPLLNRLFR